MKPIPSIPALAMPPYALPAAPTAQECQARRAQLMASVPSDSLILIPSALEVLRNGRDNHFEFRQNSDFFYLTSFNEPRAVLVLAPNRADGEMVLFNQPNDPDMETWIGKRVGQAGACAQFLFDQAFAIDEFIEQLPKLMTGRRTIYCPTLGQDQAFDHSIIHAIQQLQAKGRQGVSAPVAVANIDELLHAMRLIKSDSELALMRAANSISCQAHQVAMQYCQPGLYEYQLEALLRAQCCAAGCQAMAYPPIVAAGQNSCTLHYHANRALIQPGDLVLIDAGAELYGYAADITRTFPADGRFTAEQKMIYQIVLDAQLAVLELVRPGLSWHELQAKTVRVITEGLVAIGLLNGKIDDLIERKAYQVFYMHSVSHWLGLDTHDVGAYRQQTTWTSLAPGMVFTVEPGIYIPANTPGVDPRWWNIGVRIEDNILVTADGAQNLTESLPKTIDDIETMLN